MSVSSEGRARIIDVARQAGVSAQTVSNVINGRGGFTEPTRVKVEAAIAELGFTPNRYAQSLRSRRTGLIGFDATSDQLDVTQPFTVGLLRAVVQAGAKRDHRVLVFAHQEQDLDEFRRTAAGGLVDGFVLSDSTTGDRRPEILQDVGIPFVVLGRPGTPGITSLEIDNAAAMRLPIDHLVDGGCRDIAYVAYSGSPHWHRDRRRGVRKALSRHGIGLPRHRVLTGSTLSEIQSGLPEFLSAHGTPDAVVTITNPLAFSVTGAAARLGIRVGVDMAVTGFDDSPLATLATPQITSVSVSLERTAERLVELLLQSIDGHPHLGEELMDIQLVVRESSGFDRTAAGRGIFA